MSVWQALILGAVQGITEFLPVSSSGHILLVGRLLGVRAGMLFEVMMHVGTLLAVVIVFRKELLELFRPPLTRLWLLLLATLPAGIAGVHLSDAIDRVFGGGEWLFLTFAASAALVVLTRHVLLRREERGMLGRRTDLGIAAAMGFAQAAALLPGLSRSGTVICAGTAAGGEARDVTAFAFLMSIPVIAGSAILGACGGLTGGEGALQTAVGCAAAFATGLLSARFMKKGVGGRAGGLLAAYLTGLSLLSLTLELL